MNFPVYSVNKTVRDADLLVLVPVTVQEILLEKSTRSEDFIYSAVKRLKQLDSTMPRKVIAEKLLQDEDLISTILDRIKADNKDTVQNSSGSSASTQKEVCYVLFNHLTGIIVPRLLSSLNEVCSIQDNKEVAEFDIKSTEYRVHVIDRSFVSEAGLTNRDGSIGAEVKRLFTNIEPDPENDDYGFVVSDITPIGLSRKAYVMVGIKWVRSKIGKATRISRDNWQIDRIGGRGVDNGMRERILESENLDAIRSKINNRYSRFDFGSDTENAKINELNKKLSLGLTAETCAMIEERQAAIAENARGIIAKCFGIIERELFAILNRESKTQKEKIAATVKAMEPTWQESLTQLFERTGLTYKPEFYGYFSNTNASQINNMFFKERQASFGPAFISIMINHSITGNYEPVERLAQQYSDFMMEFDNLDMKELRNKEKHDAQAFNPEGVLRLAGKLEEALFGIDIISELGFDNTQHKNIQIGSSAREEIKKRIGISEPSELQDRFEKAYSSYIAGDSSFYFDCENVLVSLYKEKLRSCAFTADYDKNKRNTRAISHLQTAGISAKISEELTIMKSAPHGDLLAANFLNTVIASGDSDGAFVELLANKNYIVFLIDELYKAIEHHAKPFDPKQCSQFLELIEEQIADVHSTIG